MIKAIALAAAAAMTLGLVGCSHPTAVVDTTPPVDQTTYQSGYSSKLGTPHHRVHRTHKKVLHTDANG